MFWHSLNPKYLPNVLSIFPTRCSPQNCCVIDYQIHSIARLRHTCTWSICLTGRLPQDRIDISIVNDWCLSRLKCRKFPNTYLLNFKIQKHISIKNYMISTWIDTLALVLNNCRILSMSVDMKILIKAWSCCHKDHHKWKRSDSPCNTGCITVLRTRFKHMWPRAVNKVSRVIYIALNSALMRMKRRPVLLFYNQSMASEKNDIHLWGDKENDDNIGKERTKTEMKITK